MQADQRSARHQLRQQSDRLEIARFLLISLVVYVHMPLPEVASPIRDGAIWLQPAYLLNSTLLRFSVMALTVLSGFLFFATEADRQPARTAMKKAKTLIVPFLIWNVSFAIALFAAQKAGLISGTRLDLVHGDTTTWLNALFAWQTRPVNYPLYFLRDMFVISCIVLPAGRFIRANPIAAIAIGIVVAQTDIDGWLILRTPMLPAFLIGAGLAIWNVPLSRIGGRIAPLAAVLLLLCLVTYRADMDGGAYVVAIVGAVTMWSVAGRLAASRHRETLASLSRYAFPVYLIHGGVLFTAIGLGFTVHPTPAGLLVWLFTPPLVIAISILLFTTMMRVSPWFAAVSTGGRAAAPRAVRADTAADGAAVGSTG